MKLNLKISNSVRLFGCIVVAGFLAAAATCAVALGKLTVGGPVYDQIVLGKDLVADILPPPEYVLEAYLEATLALNDPASLKLHKDRLTQLHKDYDERRQYWQKSSLEEKIKAKLTEQSDAEVSKFWRSVEKDLLPALERSDKAAAERAFADITRDYTAHRQVITDIVADSERLNATIEADASRTQKLFVGVLLVVGAGVLGIIVFGVMAIGRGVVKPIVGMTGVMTALADGKLDVEVPSRERGDEMGEMAKAVLTFKEAAIQKLEMEAETARTRELSEDERRRAEEAAVSQQQALVVESFGKGIEKLAGGDLLFRLDGALPPAYEKLRDDFNISIEKLQQAMMSISSSAQEIRSGTHEISIASDDLSRRTEQQAASLEEILGRPRRDHRHREQDGGRRLACPRGRRARQGLRREERRGRRAGRRGDERHRGLVAADRPDHRRHRRDRLPDQSARPQRRRRGGARRRSRTRLRGRRLRGAGAGPALGRGREGDQGADLGLGRPGRSGRASSSARPARRCEQIVTQVAEINIAVSDIADERHAAAPAPERGQHGGQPDGPGDAAERRHGRGDDGREPCAVARDRTADGPRGSFPAPPGRRPQAAPPLAAKPAAQKAAAKDAAAAAARPPMPKLVRAGGAATALKAEAEDWQEF